MSSSADSVLLTILLLTSVTWGHLTTGLQEAAEWKPHPLFLLLLFQ